MVDRKDLFLTFMILSLSFVQHRNAIPSPHQIQCSPVHRSTDMDVYNNDILAHHEHLALLR